MVRFHAQYLFNLFFSFVCTALAFSLKCERGKSFKMHIDRKNQNTKRRVETKNIPYSLFSCLNKKVLDGCFYQEGWFYEQRWQQS